MNEQNGITRIGVKGFKSIEEGEIEIRPLTILAGANSSGKSSIMQPLLLLKQTLEEAAYDPGILKLDGPNAVFTSLDQFLSKSKIAANFFEVKFSMSDEFFEVKFKGNLNNQRIEIIENTYQLAGIETHLKITPDMTNNEIREWMKTYIDETSPINIDENSWDIIHNRFFLSPIGKGETKSPDNNISLSFAISTQQFLADKFEGQLVNLLHVSGIRISPKRSYPTTSVSHSRFTGMFENYTASIINYWQDMQDERKDLLITWLYSLGLTNLLVSKPINYTDFEIYVGRTLNSDSSDTVNIADVGLGVSHILPVLAALLVAEPGQLVYIEQPELHLHPRAQHKLAEFIAEASNRGVRVVIETHSDLLLLGIQTAIVEKKISHDKVVLHWFKRGEDGITKITPAYPDENGAYGDWDEDFSEVDLEAQRRYLDAVALKEFGASIP